MQRNFPMEIPRRREAGRESEFLQYDLRTAVETIQ